MYSEFTRISLSLFCLLYSVVNEEEETVQVMMYKLTVKEHTNTPHPELTLSKMANGTSFHLYVFFPMYLLFTELMKMQNVRRQLCFGSSPPKKNNNKRMKKV